MNRPAAGWEAHRAHRTAEDLQHHLQRQLQQQQLPKGGTQLAKTGTARDENDLGLPVLDWACAKTSSVVGVGLCQTKCRSAIVYDTERFPDGPPPEVLAAGSDDDFLCVVGTDPTNPRVERDHCVSCLTCEKVRGLLTLYPDGQCTP